MFVKLLEHDLRLLVTHFADRNVICSVLCRAKAVWATLLSRGGLGGRELLSNTSVASQASSDSFEDDDLRAD
jgi:hypothetical protein